ncbi:MAG: Ig-like domain-containing protein [Gemmatimonadales bacterium]
MRQFAWWGGIVVLAASAACGGGSTGPNGGGTVSLSAASTQLVPGQQQQVTATVKDQGGTVQPGAVVAYTSSNSSRATVDAAGLVVGVAPGSVTITGTSGDATGTLAFTVNEGGVVGAAGGTLSAYNGAAVLEVPAGALAGPTPIQIRTTANPALDPTMVANSLYDIALGGASFQTAAVLRLAYSPGGRPAGLPEAGLGIRRYDGRWVDQEPGAPAPVNQVARANVTSAGLYGVGRVVPTTPCTDAESRQFDFWVGAWSVAAGGQTIAQSDITLEPGGCAVFENYRDFGGTIGISVNLYDPGTAKWYQTYVTNVSAGRLVLSGSLIGTEIVMLTPQVGQVVDRWTWTPLTGGSVRQAQVRSTDGGSNFGPFLWNGLYTPR